MTCLGLLEALQRGVTGPQKISESSWRIANHEWAAARWSYRMPGMPALVAIGCVKLWTTPP